jgi:hypothetical protein
MDHTIATWFLLLSLILPRITLLIAWFSNCIPQNTIPLLGDAIMAILLPRILILIYIYDNLGFSPWFWVHLIFLILAWTSGITIKFKNGN